jgi:hypothetical protein
MVMVELAKESIKTLTKAGSAEIDDPESLTASDFQKELRDFGTLSVEGQQKGFKRMVELVKKHATLDLLSQLENTDFKETFVKSFAQTLKTPIQFKTRETFNAWQGRGAVVAIDTNNSVMGLAHAGFISDTEKENLPTLNARLAAGLVKAIASNHLLKVKAEGKLHLPDGFGPNISSYLSPLGYPYHSGATAEPVQYKGHDILIGASECVATDEAISFVLDGAEKPKDGWQWTRSGDFDEAAAVLTAINLTYPQRIDGSGPDSPLIGAPKVLENLRSGN